MDEARFQHFAAEKPYLFDKVDETAKKNAADWKRRRKVLVYSMNKFEVEGFRPLDQERDDDRWPQS